MTTGDSESEVLSFHELEDIVRKNDDVAEKYAWRVGIVLALIVEITLYIVFRDQMVAMGVDLEPIYSPGDGLVRVIFLSVLFFFPVTIALQMVVHRRAAEIYGDRYTQVKPRIAQRNAIQAEREAYLAKRREDYRRRKYSSYSPYPYPWHESSDDDDDDDSEDRRMCRKCHFRPVMGGRNKWRQTTCDQCLLEWDGDD